MKYNCNFDGQIGKLNMNFSIEANKDEKDLAFDITERTMKRIEKALDNPPCKFSISKDSPTDYCNIRRDKDDSMIFINGAEIRYEFGNLRKGISKFFKDRFEKIEDPKIQEEAKQALYDMQKKATEVIEEINKLQSICRKARKINEEKKLTFEEKVKKYNRELHSSEGYLRFSHLLKKVENHSGLKMLLEGLVKDDHFVKEVARCVQEERLTPAIKNQFCILIDALIEYPLFVLINVGKFHESSNDTNNDKLCGYLRTVIHGLTYSGTSSMDCIKMAHEINHYLKDLLGSIK